MHSNHWKVEVQVSGLVNRPRLRFGRRCVSSQVLTELVILQRAHIIVRTSMLHSAVATILNKNFQPFVPKNLDWKI